MIIFRNDIPIDISQTGQGYLHHQPDGAECLRAQLAAVTAERDNLRALLDPPKRKLSLFGILHQCYGGDIDAVCPECAQPLIDEGGKRHRINGYICLRTRFGFLSGYLHSKMGYIEKIVGLTRERDELKRRAEVAEEMMQHLVKWLNDINVQCSRIASMVPSYPDRKILEAISTGAKNAALVIVCEAAEAELAEAPNDPA